MKRKIVFRSCLPSILAGPIVCGRRALERIGSILVSAWGYACVSCTTHPPRRWTRQLSPVYNKLKGVDMNTSAALVRFALLLVPIKTNFSNRDLRFPLLLANENTQDWPWHGELYEVVILDRALPETQGRVEMRILSQNGTYQAL